MLGLALLNASSSSFKRIKSGELESANEAERVAMRL